MLYMSVAMYNLILLTTKHLKKYAHGLCFVMHTEHCSILKTSWNQIKFWMKKLFKGWQNTVCYSTLSYICPFYKIMSNLCTLQIFSISHMTKADAEQISSELVRWNTMIKWWSSEGRRYWSDTLMFNGLKFGLGHHLPLTYLWKGVLTHCGLVAPYGDIDLGQHWLR